MTAEPSDASMVSGLKEEQDNCFYGKAHTMLEALVHKRIFSIGVEGTEVWLTEECDQWFSITLTKAEFSQLIDELSALRDSMED